MADIQSASLASLKPAISYIVNKLVLLNPSLTFSLHIIFVNSGFEFQEDEDGNLLAVTPCQVSGEKLIL